MLLQSRGVGFPRPTAQKPLFSSCPTDVEPPRFDPDAVPPSSSAALPLVPAAASSSPFVAWVPPPSSTPMIFPCFLLLPLAQPPTRDLCLGFHEQATFGDVLRSMELNPGSTQLYIATRAGRVLKVGAKLTLSQVLSSARGKEPGTTDGWELQEGWAFEMVGVPKGPAGEAWIQQWKAEVQNGKKAIL